MLTPEELIEYKSKPAIPVLSLGQKESDFSTVDVDSLNAKLENMEQLLSRQRVKMEGQLSKAVWRSDVNKAEVIRKTGPFWETFGHSVDSRLYLYPEEALYLLDIAALELTAQDVPLSVQGAYIQLLNEKTVSLDFYRVFAYLSLLGYRVVRHSSKNVLTKYEKDLEIHKIGVKHRDVKNAHQSSKKNCVSKETYKKTDESLKNAEPNSEKDLLSRLREIGPRSAGCENFESTLSPHFDVFQPNSVKFRKTIVQLPSFRIVVCSSKDNVPDFRNFQNSEDEVPVILAIVYADFINFLQISSITLPILK